MFLAEGERLGAEDAQTEKSLFKKTKMFVGLSPMPYAPRPLLNNIVFEK